MAKIPFDIKYRPEIEAGKFKVVTEYGERARIICWDSKYHASLPIIALVDDGDGEDMIHFGADGKLSITGKLDGTILWIITDEPEPTEFQKRLVKFYNDRNALTHDADGQYNRHDLEEVLNTAAGELLAIAYAQFKENEAEIMKEYVDNVRQSAYNKGHLEGYAKGQEDAEKRHKEATSFHYDLYPLIHPVYPPCYVGGPCTNPHRDCINCPQQGAYQGACKTDTNIK